jgi:hypothetical protein
MTKGRRRSPIALASIAAASVGFALLAFALPVSATQSSTTLREALLRQDAAAIRAAVAEQNRLLGDRAGVPKVVEKAVPLSPASTWLSASEAAASVGAWHTQIEKARWWRQGLDPTQLERALREPAAVIVGGLAMYRAGVGDKDRSLRIAREAGDFLLWAQQQAGTGGFPFPAARGVTRDNAFVAAERYMKQAEKRGRLNEVVRNGWAINDAGDGGLQFDNGECGVAMFDLYETTRDTKYLDAAKKSADWALARPLAPNWNYNSFSVFLLARAYRVTRELKYLDGAHIKANLGVIPGQLTRGPNAGRWNDGHNARAGYHYIMLRALVELASAMPNSDPARKHVMAALALGLKNRNQELLERGVINKNKSLETMMMANQLLSAEREWLAETRSIEALDALVRLVSAQYRRGNAPLGPQEWGQFVALVAARAAAPRP